MTFLISFKQIAEVELSSIYDAFKFEFDKLLVGSLSLPINIPGTKYYHGLKVYHMMMMMIVTRPLGV